LSKQQVSAVLISQADSAGSNSFLTERHQVDDLVELLSREAVGGRETAMTDEEMRKMMEFILGQQAQFAANIQIHEERLTRIEEIMVRHDEKLAKIEDNLDRAAGLVGAVAVAQAETEVKQARTEERLNAFIVTTEERLNAFIVTVERYISEGRNGVNGN
jgi:hypothetical protein